MKRSTGQRTVPGVGRNTARCFGFDGITLGVLKMHIPSHFPIYSPSGVAVIRSGPAVISFICGGPATELCRSSVLLRPHLQIQSGFELTLCLQLECLTHNWTFKANRRFALDNFPAQKLHKSFFLCCFAFLKKGLFLRISPVKVLQEMNAHLWCSECKRSWFQMFQRLLCMMDSWNTQTRSPEGF